MGLPRRAESQFTDWTSVPKEALVSLVLARFQPGLVLVAAGDHAAPTA